MRSKTNNNKQRAAEEFKPLETDSIFESLPVSLHIIDAEGVILYANSKCLERYEINAEDLGKISFSEFWADEEKKALWFDSVKRDGVVNDFEMQLKTSSGTIFWALGNGISIPYQNQRCILSVQIDITERKRMESALKSNEEKYRLLTEFSSDVIWIFDLRKERHTYMSPSVYYMTGFTPEEIMSMDPSEVLTPESYLLVRESIEKNLKDFLANPEAQKHYIIETRHLCKNGEVIWVEASTKYRYNELGAIELIGASRNIEDRKKAERAVLYLSYHDQLTGLFNRRFYEEEVQRMSFPRNLPLTLVLGDVNGLKLTNDAFGHLAGDALLKQFADILNRELRAEDVAARIGGDEFILLLPKTDAIGAEKVIQRIKEAIKTQNTGGAILSVSFGWAVKETLEDSFDVLFMQAEDRMYHQKLLESAAMKNETIQLAARKLYDRNLLEFRHSENVARLSVDIGKAMGLHKDVLADLLILGRLHDIGKIGIPGGILTKKNQLDTGDWIEIRRHPEIGYQILRSADEYVHLAEAVLSHHEWYDGSGYPRNLRAQEIPLTARIVAIAEAYDTMISGNTFRMPMQDKAALEELTFHAGTQFDSEIVKIFVSEVMGKTLQ
jgi:diguanylate cyclase (GGDEF)-like protein/PAS domain S-box-containing protein